MDGFSTYMMSQAGRQAPRRRDRWSTKSQMLKPVVNVEVNNEGARPGGASLQESVVWKQQRGCESSASVKEGCRRNQGAGILHEGQVPTRARKWREF